MPRKTATIIVQRPSRRRSESRRRSPAPPGTEARAPAAVAASSATNISATRAAIRAQQREQPAHLAPALVLAARPGRHRLLEQQPRVAAASARPSRAASVSLVGCQVRAERGRPSPRARARRSRAYSGQRSSSSSWPPRSTIRPPSMTTISSASEIVDSRCATTNVVRPFIASRSPALIAASVRASTEEVASSRIRIRGIGDQRAGDRDPLALAARERQPALADDRLVAVGQLAR